MDEHLQDYLRSIGITEGVTATYPSCEVCAGTQHRVLVERVMADGGISRCLPIVACTHCGFIFQSPRFNKLFYDTYYNRYYRLMLFGDTQPERDFIHDQIRRGEHLCRNLIHRFTAPGRLLDVGCSAGGLMVPFAKRGWEVLGTDPDLAYVEFGKSRLGLCIEPVSAEDMVLPPAHFDLIIINGSLEHVFDVNEVLARCRPACKPGAMLLIEGRAWNHGIGNGHFTHNHRRYLTARSIELLMLKHGWNPVVSTEDALCGPTRPGAVFVLGKASAALDVLAIDAEIRNGRRDDVESLRQRLVHVEGAA